MKSTRPHIVMHTVLGFLVVVLGINLLMFGAKIRRQQKEVLYWQGTAKEWQKYYENTKVARDDAYKLVETTQAGWERALVQAEDNQKGWNKALDLAASNQQGWNEAMALLESRNTLFDDPSRTTKQHRPR